MPTKKPAKIAATKKAAAKKPAPAPRRKPRAALAEQLAQQVGDTPGELTPLARAFAESYTIDCNASAAYRRVRPEVSTETAGTEGPRMLGRPEVAAAVAEAFARKRQRLQLTGDDIAHMLAEVATADPRELMEVRRVPCRYCWGEGHRYQRTAAEQERAIAEHAAQLAQAEASKAPDPGAFDVAGGIGYTTRRAPHPGCPECHGDGQLHAHFHDVRSLSPAAARLFAGVKLSKDGSVEIRTKDQLGAVQALARVLGIGAENVNVKAAVASAQAGSLDELQEWLRSNDSRLPISTDNQP
jgi:hypothetical protein